MYLVKLLYILFEDTMSGNPVFVLTPGSLTEKIDCWMQCTYIIVDSGEGYRVVCNHIDELGDLRTYVNSLRDLGCQPTYSYDELARRGGKELLQPTFDTPIAIVMENPEAQMIENLNNLGVWISKIIVILIIIDLAFQIIPR